MKESIKNLPKLKQLINILYRVFFKTREDIKYPRSPTRSVRRRMIELKDHLSFLENKDCIVFGSAPFEGLCEFWSDDRNIICCNASAASLNQQFGLTPVVSVLNGNIFKRSRSTAAENAIRALNSINDLGSVVFCHKSLNELCLFEETMKGKYSSIFGLSEKCAGYIIKELLMEKMFNFPNRPNVSTGALSVALALYAGASPVQLIGISLDQKGHSYNQSGQKRSHVAADAAFFSLLSYFGYEVLSSDPLLRTIMLSKIL